MGRTWIDNLHFWFFFFFGRRIHDWFSIACIGSYHTLAEFVLWYYTQPTLLFRFLSILLGQIGFTLAESILPGNEYILSLYMLYNIFVKQLASTYIYT